jgi:hypothetical protein
MLTLQPTSTLDKPNLFSKVCSDFYKRKQDTSTMDLPWQIRHMSERIEQLEFALQEAFKYIEDLQGKKK